MTQTPDPRRRMRIAGGLMMFAGLLMIAGGVGELIWGDAGKGPLGQIVIVLCGAAVVWCGVVLRRLQPTVVGTKPPDDPGAGTPVGSKR